MSAFYKAISKIDDIIVDERIKDVFIESLQAIGDYFSYAQIEDVVDYYKYFNDYIYSHGGTNPNALKIIYYSLEDQQNPHSPAYHIVNSFNNKLKSTLYNQYKDDPTIDEAKFNQLFEEEKTKLSLGGNYAPHLNEITLFETKNQINKHSLHNYLLNNLTHEFIHALTLNGDLHYQDEGVNYSLKNGKLYKNNAKTPLNFYIYHPGNGQTQNSNHLVSFYEGATESLTSEILNNKTPNYPLHVALYNFTTNLFYNTLRYDGFLRRQISDFSLITSEKNVAKLFEALDPYLASPDFINAKNSDAVHNFQKTMLNEYFELYDSQYMYEKPSSFLLDIAKAYNHIPFKNNNVYLKDIKEVITQYVYNTTDSDMHNTEASAKLVSYLCKNFETARLLDLEKRNRRSVVTSFSSNNEKYHFINKNGDLQISSTLLNGILIEEDEIDSYMFYISDFSNVSKYDVEKQKHPVLDDLHISAENGLFKLERDNGDYVEFALVGDEIIVNDGKNKITANFFESNKKEKLNEVDAEFTKMVSYYNQENQHTLSR